MLDSLGTSMEYGLSWPVWIAAAGIVVFCLLGLYAFILLMTGKRSSARLRFLQPPTLRGRMILALVLAATLPAISLALVLSERTSHERLENVAMTLTGQASGIARVTDFFMDKATSGLTGAARHLARIPATETDLLGEQLIRHHRGQRAFKTLLLVDTNGRVIVASSQVDGQPQLFPGPSGTLKDQVYFQQPMLSGLPFVSEVLHDTELSSESTIAVSVPMSDADGSVQAIIVGALNISRFEQLATQLAFSRGISTIILDQAGQAILPTDTTDKGGIDSQAVLALRPQNEPRSVFNFEADRTDTDSHGTERFIAASVPSRTGWEVILFRSLSNVQAELMAEYFVALAWLAVAILISVCLALALANGIARPLQELDAAVRNFKIDMDQAPARPSPDAPAEVLSVFEHLGKVALRLRTSYARLRKSIQQGEKLRGEMIYVIANREKEIEKRTNELKAANDALEQANREDSLTGLANRRWFAEFFDRTWRTAMRDKTPIGILLIDIDHFKAYNDTYGHQVGDNCLKAVADAIRAIVGRASDLVARYGGEEFVIILGNTPLDGALQVGENIRTAVENLSITHAGSKDHNHVTISVGVTSTVPTRNDQPETHLVAADRALYNAKENGRNKVAYSTSAQTGIYQILCRPNDAIPRLS
jgi:diguanylate cyclase (GGDEF)-like protein